tara:strand:- start:385 stop:1242 length:858 start_codon:yes stop_codon:yes gene_type:complete
MTTQDVQGSLPDLADLPDLLSIQEEEGVEEDSLEFADESSEDSNTTKGESKEDVEPDYKALYEANQSKLKDLENRVKSQEGRNKAREARDSELTDIKNDIAAMTRTVTALVSSQAPGSTVDLEEEVGKIQNERTTEKAAQSLTAQYQTISAALAHAVHDDDDNLLLTKDQVAQVKVEWQSGIQTLKDSGYRDFNGLTNTVLSASKLIVSSERAKLKEEKETTKKSRKQADEDSGIGELDIGPGPGSGALNNLDDMSGMDLIREGMRAGKPRSRLFDPDPGNPSVR